MTVIRKLLYEHARTQHFIPPAFQMILFLKQNQTYPISFIQITAYILLLKLQFDLFSLRAVCDSYLLILSAWVLLLSFFILGTKYLNIFL